MKVIFTPISIVLGLIAGLVGKKAFERVWGLIDDEEPPSPEHREFSWPKLVAALVLEGAIFRLVKGLVDHASRTSFAKVTGSWPGEEAPEPEQGSAASACRRASDPRAEKQPSFLSDTRAS